MEKRDEIQHLQEVKRGKYGYGFLFENDGYVVPKEDKMLFEGKVSEEWYIPFPYVLHAVFQKCDTPNANGRIYPRRILEREVEKYNVKIRERRAYGESDHPESSIISTKGISMNILKLWWEGKTVVGDFELLVSPGYVKHGICSTPGDIIANNIYFNKLKMGVSSRGVGSVESGKNNIGIVGDDFELLAWDVVSDPSTPGAWADKEFTNLRQYMENTDILTVDDKKKIIFEKVDKVLELIK